MALFKPGQSGNPKGKPKGSKNKITTDIKERWKQVLENQIVTLNEDFSGMEPKDRVKIIAEVTELFVPKLSRQNIGIGVESAEDFLSFLKETR